jgi:hypothetical protein
MLVQASPLRDPPIHINPGQGRCVWVSHTVVAYNQWDDGGTKVLSMATFVWESTGKMCQTANQATDRHYTVES